MPMTIDGNGSITGLSAGGLPNASVVQADLATGVAGTGPAFSAYQNTGQALTLNTFTKISIDTEEFDTNSNYDTTLYRFTPTVAGYYQVNGAMQYVNSPISIMVAIYKNGSIFKRGVYSGSSFGAVASTLIYMNGTTDYVELYGYVGSSITNSGGAAITYFQASMVRGA